MQRGTADGDATFGERLRAAIRSAVLSELAREAATDLQQETLPGLLIIYGNWKARFVPAHPRQVHESRELKGNARRGQHTAALRRIQQDIVAGVDLWPRLSQRVAVAHVAADQRVGQPPHVRDDRDLLLADWGLHHLHLGLKRRKGRYTRRDDVLIALFTMTDAYLVDIVSHRDNWASVRLLEIIVRNWPEVAEPWRLRGAVGLDHKVDDEERLELRNAGVTVFVEIDGAVYLPVPAGQTLAGTLLAVTQHVNKVMHALDQVDERFRENSQWLEVHASTEGFPVDGQAAWRPAVQDGWYGALEESRGLFVPFGPLFPG